MQKTVLIDGYNLGLAKGTGVATYSRNLSYALRGLGYRVEVLYDTPLGSRRSDLLKEVSFFDIARRERPVFFDWLVQGSQMAFSLFGRRAKAVPINGKVVADQFRARLPYFDQIWTVPELFRWAHTKFEATGSFTGISVPKPPTVMHWTYPVPIRLRRTKNIYTLHDLVPLRLPHTTLDHKGRYHQMIRRILRQADHIVTVSESSKKDICNLFDVRPERITNTYQSVEIPERYAGKSDEQIKNEIAGLFRAEYKNYLLYFGAIEPKKNVGRMVEAYLASNVRTPLLIVGSLAWMAENDLRLVREQTNSFVEAIGSRRFTREQIMHIDYVTFPVLVSLVRGAKAMIFPSLYEGFGLPVLESMILGTPVVSSNQGSIPEVAGDAAILVDPYDTRAMADAIAAVDANADLRAELTAKGKLRAAQFSAERYRERLAKLYAGLA